MQNMNKTNPPISDKSTIRKIIEERIALMTDEKKKEFSHDICTQLKIRIKEKNPTTLILYNPLADEVDISSIHEWFAPRGQIITIEQDAPDWLSFENTNTIMLVPGRAFTINWIRVGCGRGFFDELLSQSDVYSIGICFSCQIFETLPEDTWDKKMDEVVFNNNNLQ